MEKKPDSNNNDNTNNTEIQKKLKNKISKTNPPKEIIEDKRSKTNKPETIDEEENNKEKYEDIDMDFLDDDEEEENDSQDEQKNKNKRTNLVIESASETQLNINKERENQNMSIINNVNYNNFIYYNYINPDGEAISTNEIIRSSILMSKDSVGYQIVQLEYKRGNNEIKKKIFNSLQSEILILSRDAFGNYVIQTIIYYGEKEQIEKNI